MEVIVAEEFFTLLIADSCIHQDQPVSLLNKQRAHGPATHISFIGWIRAAPKALGHHAEHGATVEPKVAGFDPVQLKRAEAHPSVILYGARGGDA